LSFSDQTQFPRGRKVLSNIDSTAVELFAVNTSFKIVNIVTSAPERRQITFREVGGGPTIVIFNAFEDSSSFWPGWQTDAAGVEVLTNSGTNDTDITVFTVEPIVS